MFTFYWEQMEADNLLLPMKKRSENLSGMSVENGEEHGCKQQTREHDGKKDHAKMPPLQNLYAVQEKEKFNFEGSVIIVNAEKRNNYYPYSKCLEREKSKSGLDIFSYKRIKPSGRYVSGKSINLDFHSFKTPILSAELTKE